MTLGGFIVLCVAIRCLFAGHLISAIALVLVLAFA